MENEIFIGVVSHKTAYFPDIPFHYPLCAGANKNKIDAKGVPSGKTPLKDNVGDNIAEKNGYYNELTAQYWMWKNIQADYIGMCHYRRYFNFSDDVGKAPRLGETFPWGGVLFKKYGWNQHDIEKTVKSADILVARETARCRPNLKISRGGKDSAFSFMGQSIDALFPEYTPYFEKLFERNKISSFNMFIMKYDLFVQYSEWLFKVESLFEEKWSAHTGNRLGRSCGTMGEYLLNVWLWYQLEHKDIICKKLQTSMFYETDLEPTFQQKMRAYIRKLETMLFPYGSKRRDFIQYKFFFK